VSRILSSIYYYELLVLFRASKECRLLVGNCTCISLCSYLLLCMYVHMYFEKKSYWTNPHSGVLMCMICRPVLFVRVCGRREEMP